MTIIQAQTAKWFLLTYDGGRNFTEFCLQATGVCGYVCVCVCVHRKQFQEFFFFKPVVVFDFFVSVHCHTQMVYLSIDRPHAKPDLKP